MENEQKENPKALPGKKELKQQLADKMETALPELRTMIGEKKFLHRVKKAAKLLMEGLHKKEIIKKIKLPAAKKAAKKVATKKTAIQETPKKVKQPAAKKSAANTSKTTAAKKANSAK